MPVARARRQARPLAVAKSGGRITDKPRRRGRRRPPPPSQGVLSPAKKVCRKSGRPQKSHAGPERTVTLLAARFTAGIGRRELAPTAAEAVVRPAAEQIRRRRTRATR